MKRNHLAAVLAAALGGAALLAGASPATGAATITVADWQMNEPAGATVMADSSGNGIDGAVGSSVLTGVANTGAVMYKWPFRSPTQPPPEPQRLVQVNDSRLNPGTGDYAVTVRYRHTHSFGNLIQKGQNGTSGGYFKFEVPSGFVTCLFKGSAGQRAIKSTLALNDGAWHTVRCERTANRLTMTIDGGVWVKNLAGPTGSISNTRPLTIGGKLNCDQVETTCDYFTGQVDWVRIERG
jgi:hypothetical protein